MGFKLSHILIEDKRLDAGCIGHLCCSIPNSELLIPDLLMGRRTRCYGDVLGQPFFSLLSHVVAQLILLDFLDRLLHLGTFWVKLRFHLDMHAPLLVNQS